MKKVVGSGVGSGSISQRYGSGVPDPHQNITDPDTAGTQDMNRWLDRKKSNNLFEEKCLRHDLTGRASKVDLKVLSSDMNPAESRLMR
jgi:hypothetical protein